MQKHVKRSEHVGRHIVEPFAKFVQTGSEDKHHSPQNILYAHLGASTLFFVYGNSQH